MKTMTFKKLGALILALVFVLSACSNNSDSSESSESAVSSSQEAGSEQSSEAESSEEASATELTGMINVVSREEGSGTRDAFTEITGVMADDVDQTTPSAIIQSGTNAVMTYVADDVQSIGYISLGSLNDTVKAIKVNGVEATEENVGSGEYELARPFNIVHQPEVNDLSNDFINFIFSKEGQDIVASHNIVAAEPEAAAYEKQEGLEGTIRVQGSTSVDAVMVELEEAYKALNPNVTFDHTANGSGAGITAAIEGNADIGMASRALKEEEKAEGLVERAIGIDGIAVIVSKENPTEDLSMDRIRDIFNGTIMNWED